jgi:hypothetical protein
MRRWSHHGKGVPPFNRTPPWEDEMEEKFRTISRTGSPKAWDSMTGGPMDTYILRVYRRKGQHPGRISGHVIKVEVKERQEFFDSEMLRNILEPTFPDTQPDAPSSSRRSGNRAPMSMSDLIRAISREENI